MINLFIAIFLIFFQVQDQSIVEKLQEKFESINYLQADFNQSAGSQNSLSGKFYFKKENNYRIDLSSNTIISDGFSIWNIDKKRNKVIISNLDEDPLAFSLSDYIYNYPAKCEVTEEATSDGFILTLSGINTDLNFKTAKLSVNQDYLIEKISVTDFGENTFILKFSNIKINDTINNSLFIYKDDGDAKIIDLR
jgi:outer membrane lipoprotein-sorting protein